MPRKTVRILLPSCSARHASMRPRPDAAENTPQQPQPDPIPQPASMRPRPDAAENREAQVFQGSGRPSFNEAAARCRGKPPGAAAARGRSRRFNEAAARCRGKRRRRTSPAAPTAASMRPRPDAAENAGLAAPAGSADPASMRPRPDAAENAAASCCRTCRPSGFNEAAARCRGKHTLPTDGAGGRRASMRPRPDAAENPWTGSIRSIRVRLASMRPRPDAAENGNNRYCSIK